MREIKIFVASSINELEIERLEIGDFIRRINDNLRDQNIRIVKEMCEYESNAISTNGRKQEDYNELIRNSDFFYMLIGEKVGQYTIEEFNEALNRLKTTQKNPAIT